MYNEPEPIEPEPTTGPHGGHLDALSIAAMLEDRLDPVERPTVEQHLASCPTCRAELHEVRRVIRTVPVPQSTWVRWGTLGAVAAAVAFLVLVPSAEEPTSAVQPALERSAAALASRPLIAYAPVGTASSHGLVRFVWESKGPAVQYQVTVVDSLGGQLWQGESADTVLLLPADVSLPRNAQLFWYVDGLGPDARARTTRAVPLRLVP